MFISFIELIDTFVKTRCYALHTHMGDHAHDIYTFTQIQAHALCNSCHIIVFRFLIFVFVTFWCCSVFSLRFIFCVHCPLPA